MKATTTILLLVSLTGFACSDATEKVDSAKNSAANAVANVDPGGIKDDIESAVVDRLECSGYVREETRDSIAATLEGRDLEGLLAEPTELAQAVGAAALTTDTTLLLVGNLTQLAAQGHMATALSQGELGCSDEPITETCEDAVTGMSVGQVTTSVVCTNDVVSTVRAEYTDGCRTFGTENSGAMEYEVDSGILAFDEFTLGTVREVSGRMAVEASGGEVRRLLLDSVEPVVIASNVGKSCEERLTIRSFDAIDDDSAFSIDFDIERVVEGDVLRVRSVDGASAWGKPVDCSCPLAGSRLELTMSDPVGLGQEGTFQLGYVASEGDVCRESEASIVTWPSGCSGDETCGRSVAEDLLGALVTTTCLGL